MCPKAYITRRELQETGEEIRELWRGLLMTFLLSHPAAARAIATLFRGKPGAPKPEALASARVVLMVDGDPVSSESFASALIEAGFEVVSVSSYIEALTRLEEIKPDMVVADEAIPESGELCSRIREGSDVPIILLGTGSPDQGWERAATLGADAYLRRATSKTEFVARVRALLRRYYKTKGTEGGGNNVPAEDSRY